MCLLIVRTASRRLVRLPLRSRLLRSLLAACRLLLRAQVRELALLAALRATRGSRLALGLGGRGRRRLRVRLAVLDEEGLEALLQNVVSREDLGTELASLLEAAQELSDTGDAELLEAVPDETRVDLLEDGLQQRHRPLRRLGPPVHLALLRLRRSRTARRATSRLLLGSALASGLTKQMLTNGEVELVLLLAL